jgi:molybdate transport system substrate-binding protein
VRKAVLLALALLATACGSSDDELTVFAAASLKQALPPGRVSFAGSQELVAQLQAGAKADVVVTADEATMQKLVDAGIAHDPTPVAANELAIATRRADVNTLADLARATTVLADPSVPLGRLTAQALAKAGVTVQPRSLELDAASTLQKVSLGEADAAVVYITDQAPDVRIVPIPAEHNVRTRYMAAALTAEGEDYVKALPALLQAKGFFAP